MDISPQESELQDQIRQEGLKAEQAPSAMRIVVPDNAELQKVFLTFSDGRVGCFVGPKIVSKLEMVRPPRLVRVDFSEPFTAGVKAEGEPNGEANAASIPSAGDKKDLAVEPGEGSVPQS